MITEEKRQYPRLTLKMDDGYFGNFKLANDETIMAPIVNISAGGLNMVAPESAKKKINVKDHLMLASIAGGTNFAFLSDVTSEVRWVEQLDTPGYISIGCRFMNIPSELRDQLIKFVNSERMSRGQYQ